MICMFSVILYCLQMCLKIFRDKCIEICGLDPALYLSAPGWLKRELEVEFVKQYIGMLKNQ